MTVKIDDVTIGTKNVVSQGLFVLNHNGGLCFFIKIVFITLRL